MKAGQTLVDIDPRDFKVAVEQAQAQLSQAQAGIQAQNPNVPITQTSQATNITPALRMLPTRWPVCPAPNRLMSRRSRRLRQAEANYANAASDEARYKQLVDKEEVSKEQYDAKLTAKLAQQAVVDAQQASADAAKDTIAQRRVGIGAGPHAGAGNAH